jgi:hypothetical protein
VTPEQEEQVRRALAAASDPAGMPPEVAARLDATLAQLVAERDGSGAALADDLEQRRRRRWPRVLVAAASVSVLAYGVGAFVEGLQASGGSASTASAGDAMKDEVESAGGSGKAGPEAPPTGLLSGDRNGVEADAPRGDAGLLLVPHTVRLHSATLDADVRRLVRATEAREPAPARAADVKAFLGSCEPPDTARGDRLAAARLDGQRGTLVLRKAVAGTRVAEVYSCGDGARLLAFTRLRQR